ncbi:MAG TPA: DUF4160 domain-containing protein [Acidimicrobiia bacterium]|nr:DUF4160 domain-containing protein [Acidimicrobiia bacterium]
MIEGGLPRRAEGLVRAWVHLHRGELEECWARVTRNQPPGTIAPLP